MSYAKIHDDILESSVWAEPYATRIVWTAMLVMADRDGNVRARALGIAKRAGVTLEEARAALATFLAPDAESKSRVADGRRVVETSTGYLIINYETYRDRLSAEERLESGRERTRRCRERQEAERAEKRAIASGLVTPNRHAVTVGNVGSLHDVTCRHAVTVGNVCNVCNKCDASGSGSSSTQRNAEQTAGGYPEYSPDVFDLFFGQWPGPTASKFSESYPEAESAFMSNINLTNYPAFCSAFELRLREYDRDQSPERRKLLGSFRTFCEGRWKSVKPLAQPPKAAPTPNITLDHDLNKMDEV
jgi:hypothetical protein